MSDIELMMLIWALVGVGCWMRSIIRDPGLFTRMPMLALLMLPISAGAGAMLLVFDE